MGAPLRVLSLCSGIGGLDIGVGLALDTRVVAYIERDPYAAAVLLERMEDEALDPAPVWVGDLRDLDAWPLAGHVDFISAGIPCQPWSLAGKRQGEADRRHLGGELLRIVREVRPSYLFVENVPGFQAALPILTQGLATLGMDAVWGRVRAEDVGAPHRRERIFLLAYTSGAELRLEPRGRGGEGGASEAQPRLAGWWGSEPDVGRVADGVLCRVDRLRCLGNAVVPQQAAAALTALMEMARV